jgi:peptidoglycan hydrolase CwlO-like protein
MEWFKSGAGQVIALVTIVGTLAGFGYTGATYVNRIENLETKIGGISKAKNDMKIIEERFMAIETSVEYINKSIDKGISPSLKVIAETANETSKDVAALQAEIEYLQNDVDTLKSSGSNPLAN